MLHKNQVKEINQSKIGESREIDLTRIYSIDFLYGITILIIVLIDTAYFWLDEQWLFAYGLLCVWLDVFGPSLFVFLCGLSVVFNLKKKMGFLPDDSIRNSILIRGLILIALGTIYNIVFSQGLFFPFNLWGWNILMFSGFSQIICYYSLKLARGMRFTAGLVIILASNELRNVLFLLKDVNLGFRIVHFIVVSPSPHFPLIPYLAFCFFSTVFGEILFETLLLDSKNANYVAFRIFIKYGLLFAIIGVVLPFLGGRPFDTPSNLNSEEFPFLKLLSIMQNQHFVYIPAIPETFVRGTSSNVFFSVGIALLMIGVSFYYIDIKQRKKNITKSIVGVLIFYGRVSISVFIIHYIGLYLYYRSMNIIFFVIFWLVYISFLGFLMYAWNKYAKGKFSFKWFLTQLTIKAKKH